MDTKELPFDGSSKKSNDEIARKPDKLSLQPAASTAPDEHGLENLCAACQRLFRADTEVAKPCSFKPAEELERSKDGFHITKQWFVHHHTGGLGLRDAAAQECPICKHIWSSFSTQEQEKICQDTSNSTFEHSDFVTRYMIEMSSSERHLEKYCIMQYRIRTFYRVQMENTGKWCVRLDDEVERDFFIMPSSDTAYQTYVELDSTTCSKSCLQQINTWLNRCTADHICSPEKSPSAAVQYPTRLIHVGTVDNPELKLCNGQDIKDETPYMSLSHCWGKAKFFTLLQSNMAELQTAIPMDKLTKTFRDSVELTRKLQVKYLWIDSLCIIQDSVDDWAFESARMMNVYSNSYCNIAATGAADGSRGLFFERSLDDIAPVLFKVPYHQDKARSARDKDINYVPLTFHNMKMTGAGGQEYSPGKPETFYFTVSDLWQKGVTYSPLGKRAWCLQERVLAPRTIHFVERQLFFECQAFQACSRFPKGVPPILIPSLEDKSTSSLINVAKVAKAEDSISLDRAHNTWRHVVEIYSACNLKFGKDKLVAISGMATFIASKLHMPGYIAGIWSYGAEDQLLWSYDMKSEAERVAVVHYERPKEYRAPSWSWASVDHAIKFSPRAHGYLAKIFGYQTWPKVKENEYGEIEYAILKVKGVVIPTRVGKWMKQLSVSLSSWVTGLQLGETKVVAELLGNWHDGYVKQMMCLPVAMTQFDVVGLVLVEDNEPRVVSEIGPIYPRAGFFELHKDSWSEFRGRPVPERYKDTKMPTGEWVRSYPNIPSEEPDYYGEDKEWIEKNWETFVLA